MHENLIIETRGHAGLLTLNRARALNALSLAMIRGLTHALLAWAGDPAVRVVGLRGMSRGVAGAPDQPFGALCAGGDIRFFHQAIAQGDPALEDFFTEEYRLNHLIHHYPKPVVVFMDGIVMGGGMGLAQGAALRLVTERSKLAMPETQIGLFPDVGGGHFLSRCPGHLGEYLALTGQVLGPAQAIAAHLADREVSLSDLPALWDGLATEPPERARRPARSGASGAAFDPRIDAIFGLPTVGAIMQALEALPDEWARATAAALRQRSPLMLCVTLEQIRRARNMSLADDLRMERDLVRHCFHPRHLGRAAGASEVVEGVRALAIDKDHAPRWNPARLEDVAPEMVAPFFVSPWPAHAHPLRALD